MLTIAGDVIESQQILSRRHRMSKEKDKQKANTKKKPQHTLKEKRQAKKEKTEGKPLQLSSH